MLAGLIKIIEPNFKDEIFIRRMKCDATFLAIGFSLVYDLVFPPGILFYLEDVQDNSRVLLIKIAWIESSHPVKSSEIHIPCCISGM
jgi:hypothetical protein